MPGAGRRRRTWGRPCLSMAAAGTKNRWCSPSSSRARGGNNHADVPMVDHVDLIAGRITGKIDPSSPDYTKVTSETTKVIATIGVGDWQLDRDGYNVITCRVKDLDASTYYRLRGTNLAVDTLYETDVEGNPLSDFLASDNLLDQDGNPLDGAEEV